MLEAQDQQVTVVKFPDGSGAYCLTTKLDNSDPDNTTLYLSDIVATEKILSDPTPPEVYKDYPGAIVDISKPSGGVICISCRGRSGVCFSINAISLQSIQNKAFVNDGNGTVIYADNVGLTLGADGNASGSSGKGHVSAGTLPAGMEFNEVTNDYMQRVPQIVAWGIPSSVGVFGQMYCITCYNAPTWCVMAISNSTTNHNDLGW